MNKLLSFLISKIKKEDYQVDKHLTTSVILMLIWDRGLMVLRGLYHKLLFKESKGILFIGNQVKIRSHNNIKCGSGMTIEDGCFINALSCGGVEIGDNFSLGRNSMIECTGVIRELGEKLTIGNNVGIAANAFIAVRGNINIGDDTIFGPCVSIHAENHVFKDLKKTIRLQGATRKGISIGKNCWIGSHVTILDGVHIGNNVVVAAEAVINKDIPDNCIAGGVPAKVIKTRE